MSSIHIADTGLFAAMGQSSNARYQAVRTFAHRNDITFVLPEPVYDELTASSPNIDMLPIDTIREEGWARIAKPLAYSNPVVARTMDGIQRYIANADDRPPDDIERADQALAGVAAQAFVEETATHAYIYTTDVAAGEGAEAVLTREGYGDSVTFMHGFRFIEDLID